jgi:predicted PurR-regulated permease PerM
MAPPLSATPQFWGWLAIALVLGGLLYLLSPILAPFLFAAILAYILDPLVDQVERLRLPRSAAIGVLAVPVLAGAVFIVVFGAPVFVAWLNEKLAPFAERYLGVALQFDVASVRALAADLVDQDLVGKLLGSLRIGGLALLAFVVNLLLVPVVLFYLLRDWNQAVDRVERLIPRHVHEKARAVLGEIDRVLAEFLRGQLLVILVMSVYFVVALWLAGLEFALPIGLISGLLVFIPYVGALLGFVLGTIAALMQFDNLWGLAWVWLAFGIGQALEGMVVTPSLVGERIGLHPVAVIFALLAFGQVFGFFGVLLALPASAALLVALRHLREAYLQSALYGGGR